MRRAHAALGVAILAEVVATSALKASGGFTRAGRAAATGWTWLRHAPDLPAMLDPNAARVAVARLFPKPAGH
ncbi:hypothetical protein E0493_12485 [Roseomonas sp. M0104]|uniref:Uncharacterized protein n=1 Tax=Teichococcus coralli TaxID=2545983 RepID=A0A845BG04_9PROT|nr:hypothetical protein [Pseudoroseomonas coralli]MXP64162.1 hypothetical protein [Pseudoroseomonas coralli]